MALFPMLTKQELIKKFLGLKDEALLRLDISFDDFRDCSKIFQKAYMDARKAIDVGSLKKLNDSMSVMKTNAGNSPGSEKYLDVCYLQHVVSPRKKEITYFYTTLLAHAAVQRQRDMVDKLIDSGARSYMGNGISGSPLTQVLVYALNFSCPEIIYIDIIKCFELNNITLDVNFFIHIPYRNPTIHCSPIELAIDIKRSDVAKLFVEAGANPIDPRAHKTEELRGVTQLFNEYYEFGTSHYISFLLQEHLLSDEIPQFIDTVVKLDIFNEDGVEMFKDIGRHPAHAILTCGHEEMTEQFLEHCGYNHLMAKDTSGRTALQISAEMGDLKTVRVLLSLKDHAYNDKTDMARALLAAARGNHIDIVKHILLKDPTVTSECIKEDRELIDQAMTEDLSCVFEALRDFNPNVILSRQFGKGNILAHIAAQNGNCKLFKVVFPLTAISDKGMFAALKRRNDSGKTPLELAVENNHLCVLEVLRERIMERESRPSSDQNKEKNEWNCFWEEWGPKLLMHACSHKNGSVDAVKLFVEMKCPPNYERIPVEESPLSCASRVGKDDIVDYLLSLGQIEIPKYPKPSPLLLAAANGHARCVKLLLNNKEADVNECYPKSNKNSLMLAIEGKYRKTVLTILFHRQGMRALRFGNSTTPMRLLIEHMPEVAEWVLDKYALRSGMPTSVSSEIEDADPIDGNEESSSSSSSDTTEDKFELLEDFQSYSTLPILVSSDGELDTLLMENDSVNCKWGPKKYVKSKHPLKLMVKFEREKLLNHPLVEELIEYKWKRIGIPGLLIHFGFYLMFLSLLTAYALVLHRPSLEKQPCSNSTQVDTKLNLSTTSQLTCLDVHKSCQGYTVNRSRVGFLYFSAVMTIIFCIIYLIRDAYQIFLRHQWKYFKVYESYIQWFLYIFCILFVFPVGHDNWCFPSWKWQIGATTLFLAWFNCILLLKRMPYLGQNITMLINVYINFIKLIYLPVLLILTFGFPFYMLITYDETRKGDDILNLFSSPITAIWNTMIQTVGGIKDEEIFNGYSLLYPALSYILFIVFLIAMPVLFNAFLVGMAVGETEKERKKASLTLVKAKVNRILDIEDSLGVSLLRRFYLKRLKYFGKKKTLDGLTELELKEKTKAIVDEIKAKDYNEYMKKSVISLDKQVVALKKDVAQVQAVLSEMKDTTFCKQCKK